MKRYLLFILSFLWWSCNSATFSDGQYRIAKIDQGYQIMGPEDRIQLNFFKKGLIKVTLLDQSEHDFSFVEQQELMMPELREYRDSLVMIGDQLRLMISKSPLTLTLQDENGNKLTTLTSTQLKGKKRQIKFERHKVEAFYGMGQKTIGVNRIGHAFSTTNNHQGGYSKAYENLQVNIPYVYTDQNFGIFIDNSYTGYFDLCKADSAAWHYESNGGQMVFYFTTGQDLQALQNQYFQLTGFPALPPRWVFGLMQSKCSYKNEQEVKSVVKEFQTHDLPLDAIILDANWFGGYDDGSHNMGNFTWLKSNFPNPKSFMQDLKSQGIKTLIINEPQINVSSENFDFLDQKGWLMKVGDSSYVLPSFWAGSAALLDLTHPDAQQWLWQKQKANLDLGLDAFWVDLTEPDVSTEEGQFFGGEEPKIHNIYSYLFAQLLDQGMKKDFPDRRLYNITRAGTAGMHKFGAFNWSGDAAKNFEALELQIPMLIGCSMSGMPHFASDIGGFTNAWDRIGDWQSYDGPKARTTPELYTRWFQFGVFSPILRPHSGEDQPCEPYAFDQQTLDITRDYLKLRYRLIPYIYSYAARTSFEGEQLIKPLFMKYKDPVTPAVERSYLFGDFLVAPVYREGVRKQTVYLPQLAEGEKWFDFWSDQEYAGGLEHQVEAGLEKIPVFVSSGTIYPLADEVMRADQLDQSHLSIVAYSGAGSFKLYEDDGLSRGYERGHYGWTQFDLTPKQKGLHLKVSATGEQAYDSRSFTIILKDVAEAGSLIINGEKLQEGAYKYDASKKQLIFECEKKKGQDLEIQVEV
ncbi:TIM-barrel domain-containing protein [Persicobacter diffluens]|uniref:Alpha-glucosidase n=1 Tax=Persicobacter diffluens TaxID=981 RepID=A0AAN5AMF8_9BACT|nr:alpha-glucosidase [Persicobacter diffluens]